MSYVDGFVMAVPTANREKFLKHANEGDPVFISYGALRVIECWGRRRPARGTDRLPPRRAGAR